MLKAIRDNDMRAEFMGYNAANYRIFVFCVSAFMAAAAGAMYAAWVGIVSFLDAGPLFSVEGVIWTAVGGQGHADRAVPGCLPGARARIHAVRRWFANYWQFFMGILFIAVVLWMPDGIVGTIGKWYRRRKRGSLAQIREDEARLAHDRQRDWQPAGAAKPADNEFGLGGRIDGAPRGQRSYDRGLGLHDPQQSQFQSRGETSCACSWDPTEPARRRSSR